MDKIIELLGHHHRLYNRLYKTMLKYKKLRVASESYTDDLYRFIEFLSDIEKGVDSIGDADLRGLLTDWIRTERKACDQAKDDFRLRLGQQLSQRFNEAGKKVAGQYPVLRIGLYSVRFDFEFGEASLFFGPEVEPIKNKVSLSADAICTILTAFDDALKSSPLDQVLFQQDLTEAYQRLLRISGRSRGEKMPILKVLAEYVFLKQSKKFFSDPQRENFKGSSRISLSYDLYRFRKTKTIDSGIHLHVATFDATVDKASALWVPDNEDGEGTYYSYLSLEDA